MTTTAINGVRLFHEATGTGECVVLTHGSWNDGTGWARVVPRLAERFRVVVWDRRGHSRSHAGAGPGSRSEDAADLAGLIEHVADRPVHVVGNSYGANVTLTLVTERPDLVATAAVHEPPLWGLLEGTSDEAVAARLASFAAARSVVVELISAGRHREAAQHFVEHIALGPGAWNELPPALQAVMVGNAPTFLDETADDTALSIDIGALAGTSVPLQLGRGTESPELFGAVVDELHRLVPAASVSVLEGAGHLPHATHPELWTARLVAFIHAATARTGAART